MAKNYFSAAIVRKEEWDIKRRDDIQMVPIASMQLSLFYGYRMIRFETDPSRLYNPDDRTWRNFSWRFYWSGETVVTRVCRVSRKERV